LREKNFLKQMLKRLNIFGGFVNNVKFCSIPLVVTEPFLLVYLLCWMTPGPICAVVHRDVLSNKSITAETSVATNLTNQMTFM